MSEKWSGDGTYYLAARSVEAYRLWFEFLKQAHRDNDIAVDYEFYADWGNFWEKSFSDWWAGETWRTTLRGASFQANTKAYLLVRSNLRNYHLREFPRCRWNAQEHG
jgi:hypothetical protein